MRCAVLIVYLFEEEEKTNKFINSLLSDNGQSDLAIYKLCNGDKTSETSPERTASKCFRYSSKRNIGIAAARNFLVEKALSDGISLFIFLDNDIILPPRYIESVSSAFLRAKDELINLGGVVPIVIDQDKLVKANLTDKIIRDWQEIPVNNKSLDLYYFLGVNKWKEIYVYSPAYAKFIEHFGIRRLLELDQVGEQIWPADKEEYRKKVFASISQHSETATLPGGVVVFDDKLWKHNGPFSVAFSPYGNEDSEFFVRAHHRGYTNVVLKNVAVIHKNERGSNRNYFYKRMIEGRMRRILIDNYIDGIKEKLLCYVDSTFGFIWVFLNFKEFRLVDRLKIAYWYLYGYFSKPRITEKQFCELAASKGMERRFSVL